MNENGFGGHDRLAEELEPGPLQGAAGLDHVGHRVCHAESHRRFDGAVELDQPGADAVAVQVLAHQTGVRGGDALAGQVCDGPGRSPGCGEAKPGAPEAQRQHLDRRGGRVDQHVAAGDAQIEGALADVHRDVARAQVVELDPVVFVEQHQVFGVVALSVARLAQHLGGRLRQGALVGHGDFQQRTLGHPADFTQFSGVRSPRQPPWSKGTKERV